MASQGPQPIAQTLNSNTDALQNLRERMADVVETSSLTAAQKTAMMKELVEADYSISRLINIVANSSQDENFTKLAPNTAPNCIRLCCYLLPQVDVELKEFFVKRIGNIVASHGKAVADIDDYLPNLLNATIVALDRGCNAPKAHSGQWVWDHLLLPLVLSADRASIEQGKPFRWVRNALQLVETDTRFQGQDLAAACVPAMAMLSAIRVPEGFVLLQECLASTAHLLYMEPSSLLLQICLQACQQPQASAELKWQAIKTIQQIASTPNHGADAVEIAAGFRPTKLQETLGLLESFMTDGDQRLKEAARDALIAMAALYDQAQLALEKQREARSEEVAAAGHKEAEDHSINPTRVSSVEQGIANVTPPPVPAQSEGARREMASSSGDKSPTPETLGTPEVVVVFEQPNATAPEASDRLSKKQTPGIEFPEVTRREDGSLGQEVQYEESPEHILAPKKSGGVVSKITAFATNCFTGGGLEASPAEKARESSIGKVETSPKASSASSRGSTETSGSTAPKKEKKARKSLKRAFARCFIHEPCKTDPSIHRGQKADKLSEKERSRGWAKTWGRSINPSTWHIKNAA